MDLRKIKTQEDLEYLFNKTNFVDDDNYSELQINEPDEDGYQFVWIPECCWMGSMVPQDVENSGEDALFLQTIVQMFKAGKLKVKEEKKPNYVVTTRGFSGANRVECSTPEEVWEAIGKASFGALYEVDSPVGLDVGEFIPF